MHSRPPAMNEERVMGTISGNSMEEIQTLLNVYEE
jgi:hypothetical protein